ncbi:hypothetical protein Pyn_19614 [Prunus yedoensis var. nudiflora]|uniref:non-specific serine/threonine protein kinase n=1 Tax=Prunus yedoensis var. nudiflora TaxID=2094558 RepID=A0A314XUL3_PRUYE|nr:hypothetical protein Pyn_19614 [Prunus yedoensis var. nudiflora]
MAQNATTDPSEVTELISIFKQWDMQALPISGGQPGIGFAINGSEFEKPENNPAITCDFFPTPSLLFGLSQFTFSYKRRRKIDQNYFTGPLPAFVGNMSVLMVLSIAINSFSGPIPKELGNLKELTVLSFGSNNFSGTLPPELGNLVKLEQFYMDSCGLSGEIPSTFAKLINMQVLWASNIPFSGKIPAFIGNWTKLTALRTPKFFVQHEFSYIFPKEKSTSDYVSPNVIKRFVLQLFLRKLSAMGNHNIATSSWIELPQRNFPCNRNTPRYANFSIKCGGPQMRGSGGILYEAEDSALSPATFNVTSTQKWAVSNVGLFSDRMNQSFVETTLTQVSGTDVTPKAFQDFKNVPSRTTQTWQNLGRRVFDIYIQGNLRRKDFDISKEAGVNVAVARPFKVNVTKNYLDIHLFWAGKGTYCIPEQGDYGQLISAVHAASVLYMQRKTSEKDDDEDKRAMSILLRGTLSDGRVVAVKQLSVASHQGKSQFVTEIATISAVQRRNLVKLYGCCIEGSHRILVYEYRENKSLDQALFGRNDLHLDWPTRFNILLGTARGLTYLHEESKPRIVHRDVKAINILLDAELSPKISDFGWAKLYDDDKTHLSTRAWNLHENDQSLGLVDPRLTEFDENDATRLIKAAFLCTQASPMMRPSMSHVVAILSGDIEASTVMSKPSY